MRGIEKTRFLNVDVDVYSRRDLTSLIEAFGSRVVVLYSGRVKRTYRAHLEVARITNSADAAIRGFCKLISSLPKTARAVWDSATLRCFNVGVQAGLESHSTEIILKVETVEFASAVKARLVVPVYASEDKPSAFGDNV